MLRSTEEIKKDLINELYWDNRVDASEVKAEVSNGNVTLGGTVPGYTARDAATAAAWGIDDVTGVTNLLSVRFPSDIVVSTESEIKLSAERSLGWNPDVYSADIDVTVTNGVVRTVPSNYARGRAYEAAALTKGVIEVNNKIVVA